MNLAHKFIGARIFYIYGEGSVKKALQSFHKLSIGKNRTPGLPGSPWDLFYYTTEITIRNKRRWESTLFYPIVYYRSPASALLFGFVLWAKRVHFRPCLFFPLSPFFFLSFWCGAALVLPRLVVKKKKKQPPFSFFFSE